MPIAEKLRPLPDKIFSREETRDVLGDFVFSVSQSSNSDTGTGKKQFEVGEFLEFGQISDVESVTVTEVPDLIDLQQNTNLLDLSEFGLTDEEIESLTDLAAAKMNQLIVEINDTRTQIKDNEIQISENQKSINEATKAIKAVIVITGEVTDNDILNKLIQSEQDLVEERDKLITETNELNVLIKVKFQELLDTRELVR